MARTGSSLARGALRCAALIALAGACFADGDVTFSGFASFTDGKILGGNGQNSWFQTSQGYKCPCAVENYEYAGVYQNQGWTAAPESIVALQGEIHINDRLSGIIQVDGRDVNGYQGSVDWAYLSYVASDHWTLQAGHKRIPMYYYADSNYIGYSYTWVRPPVDVYGWDVYEYDGANALFKYNFANRWTLLWNTWAGNQDTTNNVYWAKLYNANVPTTSDWHNIIGSYADLANDDIDFRLIYMQNSISVAAFTAPGVPYTPGMDGSQYRQRVLGAAFNVDYGNWVWRSEYNNVERYSPWAAPKAPSWIAGAGYHYRDFTFMYTYSKYWEQVSSTYTSPQRDDTVTATVRWDFNPSAALKFQYDYVHDHSPSPLFGDAKLATVSLVTVF